MDLIFKALSDDTRRQLLDRLRERDGQTLTELEPTIGMTRFGVMKHLKLLEAAHLVLTRKSGRFKYHYLNAAPLQSLVDRWIEPLTQQKLTRAVLDLKADLERTATMPETTMTKPDFVLETYIRTTPEKVWEALTSGEITRRYMLMEGVLHGKVATGESYEYHQSQGRIVVAGKFLAVEPLKRLDMTFQMPWTGPDAPISRNVYEITPAGDMTRLTILHYDLPAEMEVGIKVAWAQIASSLKSYLETGKGLVFTPHDGPQA